MSFKPRSVIVVAQKIISIIPDNQNNIRVDIQKFINGLWNQAPEALFERYNWVRFITLLNQIIKPEYTDLIEQIQNILNG